LNDVSSTIMGEAGIHYCSSASRRLDKKQQNQSLSMLYLHLHVMRCGRLLTRNQIGKWLHNSP